MACGISPRSVGGLLGVAAPPGRPPVLLFAIALGYNYLAWTRTEYFFDESGDFRLDSGVLQRNERRVTLSRLQSVDTNRPLLGRVVGLSQVRIEVAGGGDSRVLLSYLTDAEAQALRAEIIARAAGMSPDVGEAPEAVLATVPTGDLVVSLLLRSETDAPRSSSPLLIVVSVTLTEGAAGLLLILVTGGLPLLALFGQFTRFFGFTVADSPDGLRLRHGLVNVQSQTVPPGRVQAIEISEPLLWRRKGWVRVTAQRRRAPGRRERPAGARAAARGAPRRGPPDHLAGDARRGPRQPWTSCRPRTGPAAGRGCSSGTLASPTTASSWLPGAASSPAGSR